jgi:hypothetical protein
MLAENKEHEFIAARTRKAISKAIFKAELSKEAVRIIEISAKLIDMIAPYRDPNIVYENIIKEDPILSKIMITKIIPNKNKSSYEIAMASSKIFQ